MALSIEWIIVIALFTLFFIISSVTLFIVFYRVRWPILYELYEKVNGRPVRVKKGRARLMKIGDGGEQIYYLKNSRLWKIGYGDKMGQKLIWWYIGEDGYWYDFTLADIDKQRKEMGAKVIDRDMRFSHSGLRKHIKDRYEGKSFMDKYGTFVFFGLIVIILIIVGIFLWIVFDKQAEVATANAQFAETSLRVMEASEKIISNLDNLRVGGTGFVGGVG